MNIDNEYKYNFKLNSKSLLFARVASDAIKDGEYEKALSILETGIEHFDEYPTPFFLLGDSLIKLGNMAEAKIAFQKGNALLNNPSTLNYYLNLRPDSIENDDATDEPEHSKNPDDDLVELADFLPTICEIATAPEPSQEIRGQSFYPQLLGKKGKSKESC